MARTALNLAMRISIVLLAVLAGTLACAIYVAAVSRERSKAEAALTEARSQADEARSVAAQHSAALEREDADLKKQLEAATAALAQRADELAAAKHETSRLRGDLDKALEQAAELNRKYADAQAKVEARDSEHKTNLDADAVKQDPDAAVVKVPVADNQKRGQPFAANRRRGPVASLPRTCPSFSELDTNHDGRLSLKEYKVGYPDAVDVEKEFKALDTNGDGTLSIDEYKAGHPDPPVVPTKRPKRR
jgi:DNA repair exonuclease SbcCD ATPase subunit